MNEQVALRRWSGLEIAAIIIFTLGLGWFYLTYIHYKAIKGLNPQALDPVTAISLNLVGACFTGGLLSIAIEYSQLKRLVDYANKADHPQRNHNLMLIVMGSTVASWFSVWLSFTGFMAIGVFIFAIYATTQTQEELERYTVPG
ncbi:hypothetical protein L6R49_30820 [Myxococcota bacterium]|nr:hypothetical protein [Myxococcota bacterium]